MSTLGGTYSTGAVAVVNGSKSVTGSGVLWSDVTEGDWLVVAGSVGIVDAVTDTSHLTLKTSWPGSGSALGPIALSSISNGASALFTTAAAHGLALNDPIVLTTTGTLPTGLLTATTYYVIPVSATTFRVSATVNGSAVDTSSAGSGTHSFTRATSAYVILKMSWLRYDPALTQAKLREFLAQLEGTGTFVYVSGSAPDPELGEDGQFALKTNTSPWTLWLKSGGVWVQQAGPSGAAGSGGFTHAAYGGL